jgi:hypothetical protein
MRSYRKNKGDYPPYLKVSTNHREDTTELGELVETAWIFASSSLWNCSLFSAKEIDTAKESIREYLRLSDTTRNGFLSFCQRVLLARYYLNNSAGRHIPLPSVWLDKNNDKGFAGTKEWFIEIMAVRESLPQYKADIKALSEAVLEFSEDPTEEKFYNWKNHFIERQTPGLLTLFQVFATNCLYAK